MTPQAIAALVMALEPSVQKVVVDIVKALHAKDVASVRTALEAAQRLEFEALNHDKLDGA